MATRTDSNGTLGKVQRTPQGGAIVPALVARSGVLVYQTSNGPRREYRPDAEVFAPESLESLQNAPVTLEHPYRKVDPSIYREVTRGNVIAGTVTRADDKVATNLAIQDSELLDDIDSGKRTECSAGYDCVLIPAVNGRAPDGTPCDFVQTCIRYNHVAITSKGRSGPEVCLRLDSEGNEIVPSTTGRESIIMRQIKIGGLTFNVGPGMTEADVSALEAAINRESTRFDSEAGFNTAALSSAKAELEKERAARKAAEERAIKAARYDAEDMALLATVQSVMGADFDPTGKTPEELMAACVAKAFPDVSLDGKSPDYIAGLFAAIKPAATTDAAPADDTAPKGSDPPAGGATDTRTDSLARANARLGTLPRGPAAAPSPDAARRAMIEEQRERGNAPLGKH